MTETIENLRDFNYY